MRGREREGGRNVGREGGMEERREGEEDITRQIVDFRKGRIEANGGLHERSD